METVTRDEKYQRQEEILHHSNVVLMHSCKKQISLDPHSVVIFGSFVAAYNHYWAAIDTLVTILPPAHFIGLRGIYLDAFVLGWKFISTRDDVPSFHSKCSGM